MLGLYGVFGKENIEFPLVYQDNPYHFVKDINFPNIKIKNAVFDFQQAYQHYYEFEGGWLVIFGDPLLQGFTGDQALKAAAKILSNIDKNRTAIADIDGLFNAVVFYEKTNSVNLVNDRNGLALLYYGVFDDRLCFASELRAFINSGLTLNIRKEAIDEFLNLGYHIKHETYFKEVELIPPASVLSYSLNDNSFDISSYWDFKSINKINPSYKEAKETLHQLIKQAVAKRVGADERVGITLSGGLDSRLLFANIPDQNKGFTAITRGMKDCADIVVSKEVTAVRSDCHHIIYDMNVSNWLDNREEAVIATSGQKNFFDMNAVASLHMHKKYFDINLDGAGGDGIFQKKEIIFDGDQVNLKKQVEAKYFNSLLFEDERSINSLVSYFSEIGDSQFVFLHQKMRRFSIFGSILGHDYGVMTRFPFLDNELLDYIYSLPDTLDYNKIYREILIDFYPSYFKKIRNNNTGFRIYKHNIFNVVTRVINRIKKTTGLNKFSQNYHNYPVWIKENDNRIVESYLNNREANIYKYVNYDQVQQCLSRFSEKNSGASIISRLISASLFLQSLHK